MYGKSGFLQVIPGLVATAASGWKVEAWKRVMKRIVQAQEHRASDPDLDPAAKTPTAR